METLQFFSTDAEHFSNFSEFDMEIPTMAERAGEGASLTSFGAYPS